MIWNEGVISLIAGTSSTTEPPPFTTIPDEASAVNSAFPPTNHDYYNGGQLEIGVFVDPAEKAQSDTATGMGASPSKSSHSRLTRTTSTASAAVETFADVDQLFFMGEKDPASTVNGTWNSSTVADGCSSSPLRVDVSSSGGVVGSSRSLSTELEHSAGGHGSNNGPAEVSPRRRRVTFSNEVCSAAVGEDESGPSVGGHTVSPLKSADDGSEGTTASTAGKVKRRGRDSRRHLTSEERVAIASAAQLFLSCAGGEETKCGLVVASLPPTTLTPTTIETSDNGATPPQPPPLITAEPATHFLERLAADYKCSVAYSDFPKVAQEHGVSGGDDESCFALVTIGLATRPIVCPGTGRDVGDAQLSAAYAAVKALSQL